MKILFILSIALDKPGPSVHILTSLMEGLAKKGHEVRVILQGDGKESIPENLVNLGVESTVIQSRTTGKNNFIMRYLRQLSYVRSVAKALKKQEKADIVYVHSNTTQLAFVNAIKRRMSRARVVLNVQDIFPENMSYAGLISPRNPLYKIMAAMQHKAYRKSDAIITLSEDMKQTLKLAGADNVEVIPLWSYGDDVSPIDNESNRVLAKLEEERKFFRCVYAGNTGNMQNVEVILQAADILRDITDIKFLIVGDGARINALKEVKRDKRLDNVRFVPLMPPELAPDIYSMAGVNLITLRKGVIKTAFPSKTTTCCAVGRPIIACVDGDSRYSEMISKLDGCRVVDCDDADALARAIVDIRDSRVDKSVKARELYSTRLSQSSGIDLHEALFKKTAEKGQHNER